MTGRLEPPIGEHAPPWATLAFGPPPGRPPRRSNGGRAGELDRDAVKSLEDNCATASARCGEPAAALVDEARCNTRRGASQLAGLPAKPRLDPGRCPDGRGARVPRHVLRARVFVARPRFARTSRRGPGPPVGRGPPRRDPARAWEVEVDVLQRRDGRQRGRRLRQPDRRLAYQIGEGRRRPEARNYEKTLVYYPPGAEDIAPRLADELDVERPRFRRRQPPPRRHVGKRTSSRAACSAPRASPSGPAASARPTPAARTAAATPRTCSACGSSCTGRDGPRPPPLRRRQLTVEEWLKQLLALLARVEHQESSPTAASASDCFRIRRPRWRRDITVPIGTSRICAASW